MPLLPGHGQSVNRGPISMTKSDNPEIRGTCLDKTSSEAEHYIVCDICGQAFDARDLDEIFRHWPADHERVPLSS